MKAALSFLVLGYLFFFAAAQQQQNLSANQLPLLASNLLTVQGYGTYTVSTNTTTLAVTLYGYGPNATFAQQALLTQIQYLQQSLSSVSLMNLQIGGIMYYPYYGAPLGGATGESTTATASQAGRNVTGFITTTSISFTLNALDTAKALDALMANGTAYISISSRPDPQEIEQAQVQAVGLAVNDALYKAQSALSRLGLCTLNFTLVNIESPINMLPAINILSDNFGLALAAGFGFNLPTGNGQGSLGLNTNNGNNNMVAGRMQITADVLLTLFHTSCSTPGAIADLTANLTQPAYPGFSGILGSSSLSGILGSSSLPGSSALMSSAMSSAMSESSSGFSGSFSGSSASGGSFNMRRRSFW